jgi:PAS domain S-box-containing protein
VDNITQNEPAELSGRETEILYLAADGLTDKEIGRTIGIGEGTIRTYWERVRKKLGAVNRAQALSMVLAKEHKKAVQELRLSELRLTLIFESADNMAIFFMNPDGIIISWNIGVRNVLGHTEEEFIGKPYSEIFIEADLLTNTADYEISEATLHGRYPETQWHKRRDGSMVWVEGDLFSIKNGNGEVEFYAKVLQDATEKKGLYDTAERQRIAIEALTKKSQN